MCNSPWYLAEPNHVCYNKCMKTTKQTILNYLREIKPELKKKGIDEIALFGSFATNEQNVYSDIDIAIKKTPAFLENYAAYDYFMLVSNLKQEIRLNLHRNSDVFDLDSNSPFPIVLKER